MKRWTDKAIKQNVEDIIEESYILSLSDDEIREYFRDFIDACDHVLRTNISLNDDLKVIRVKMALLKARLLVEQNTVLVTSKNSVEKNEASNHKILAGQILKTKKAIISFLGFLNPGAVIAVLEETGKRKKLRKRKKTRNTLLNKILLTVCYYLLLTGAVALTLFAGFY